MPVFYQAFKGRKILRIFWVREGPRATKLASLSGFLARSGLPVGRDLGMGLGEF